MKNRILNEIRDLKQTVSIIEYLTWWILRIAMLATYIYFTVKDEALYQRNLVLLNSTLTFVIPLLRFISPRKLFTSKVSFHTQTFINIFIFLGSFLGHGFNLFLVVDEYDKFMHIASGGVVVFIGVEVIKAFKGHEKISPGIKTFCGVGFSYIVMVIWEMIEFFSDWYITDSNNQGFYKIPDETMLFVKIFGMPKNFPDQAPVYDTNVDLFYAIIGCGVCAAILYIFLKKKAAKEAAKEKELVAVS